MRIISGKYRSRKINSALPVKENCIAGSHGELRPTSDRARESLFNILNNIIDFDGLKCLDLFAGTGAVGFELLSRGAASVDFVDISPKQLKLIELTAGELGCNDNVSVIKQEAKNFIIKNKGSFYDLIFADPPYNSEEADKDWINFINEIGFTVLIIEQGPADNYKPELNGYESFERKTGITKFKIFVSNSED